MLKEAVENANLYSKYNSFPPLPVGHYKWEIEKMHTQVRMSATQLWVVPACFRKTRPHVRVPVVEIDVLK